MGFDDLPQVDGASINDDRAKKRLLLHFGRDAGFIAREQFNDMGCDYKVELIENGATNWSFDIQLKSVEKPKFVSDGQFLSFPIKTSRFGYLTRNESVNGLLVVYDVGTELLYFDFLDLLYGRLMRERESDDWLANDEVNVHVPKENILDRESREMIHGKFLQRFRNLATMIRIHGGGYGLPVLGPVGPIKRAVIPSAADAVAELRSFGAMQLMQRDMRRVYELLEGLPENEIIADKELLLIALLAYCEVGRIADSMYYIDRVSKRYELKESERRMVSFISLKNELLLGDIDRATFVGRAKLLLPGAGLSEELSLRLNLLYYQLSALQGLEPLPERLVTEFEDLESMISKVEGETQRMYIRAWNLDNLSIIAGHVRREDMNRLTVFKRFGMDMPTGLRQKSSDRSSWLFRLLHRQFAEIVGFSLRTGEFMLTAMVTLSHLRFWMGVEMDMLVFGDGGISREKIRSEMHELIAIGLQTAQMLLELNRFRQAYLIQSMVLELLLISRQVYRFEDGNDMDKIKEQMRTLERDLELPPFVSQMQPLIDKKLTHSPKETFGMHGMKGLNDTQIDTYARYVLESGCYPNAIRENLVHEMIACRTFSERAADDRYDLIIIKPVDKKTAYAYPAQFFIRDKKTGIESLPGTDIKAVLESFGV